MSLSTRVRELQVHVCQGAEVHTWQLGRAPSCVHKWACVVACGAVHAAACACCSLWLCMGQLCQFQAAAASLMMPWGPVWKGRCEAHATYRFPAKRAVACISKRQTKSRAMKSQCARQGRLLACLQERLEAQAAKQGVESAHAAAAQARQQEAAAQVEVSQMQEALHAERRATREALAEVAAASAQTVQLQARLRDRMVGGLAGSECVNGWACGLLRVKMAGGPEGRQAVP